MLRLLSEEISFYCGAKGQLLTLNDINILYPICFTNKHIARERDRDKGQTNKQKVRETDLDQQARHFLVTFENLELLEATFKTETTLSNLSCS